MGQIVAAGISAASQAATNQTNLDIAKKYNQNQLDIWREQQAHDLDMWERENQYNSPAQQMARLEAAGINPLMLENWNPAGNSTQSAGGQTPPALNTPQIQSPLSGSQQALADAFDVQKIASAYNELQQGRKTKSEAGLAGLEEQAYKQAALAGENPYIYKAKTMLAEWVKLKKENKWIDPIMEKNLAKLGAEVDLDREFARVRRQECKMMKEQTKGLGLTNRFNAEMFPKQLLELTEKIKSIVQTRQNEMALNAAQVKQANASANLMDREAELAEENKKGQEYDNITREFKAGLANLGINPDAVNTPIFFGIAQRLAQNKINPADVTEFFNFVVKSEKIGWNRIAQSTTDLTKYQMLGQKSGIFGSGLTIPDILTEWSGFFKLPNEK